MVLVRLGPWPSVSITQNRRKSGVFSWENLLLEMGSLIGVEGRTHALNRRRLSCYDTHSMCPQPAHPHMNSKTLLFQSRCSLLSGLISEATSSTYVPSLVTVHTGVCSHPILDGDPAGIILTSEIAQALLANVDSIHDATTVCQDCAFILSWAY
jgi:hypothetical protein